MKKILIIRFSSLGDIAQALAAAQVFKDHNPQCEIHWAVRSDLASLLEIVTCVDKVWSLKRSEGWRGLLQLARTLRHQNFDFIYDAHSNVRSHFLSWFLRKPGVIFVRRPKERWKRFLLFKLRRNYFPKPYRGALSYLEPLKHYVSFQGAPKISLKPYEGARPELEEARERILLAPSAAWDLKKWPLKNWQQIVYFLEEQNFALLGGPDDQELEVIRENAPEQVKNWAGQLSWAETAYAIQRTPLLISGDTGALHLGDAFGTPTIAIIGPSAFGHPSRPNSVVVEKDLWCRPCTKDGRGFCKNSEFKKCLNDITPQEVVEAAASLLAQNVTQETHP